MQIYRSRLVVYLGTLGVFFLLLCTQPVEGDAVYIVYMGKKRFQLPHLDTELHYQMLSSVLLSQEAAASAMVYSYNHSFCGFAAKLNATHAETLSTMEGVVSVFKSKVLKLHTTRSWDFMGLNLDARLQGIHSHRPKYGGGVIIGVIDSGIWPESESFKDGSLEKPPSRWKGVCQTGERFDASNCNRKLIGARWYVKGYEEERGSLNTTITPEYRSARDHNSHGTHTSSTAGGNVVKGANFFGFGKGDARGGAPGAWIAMYKVCWAGGFCTEADILAAYNDALNDGVDVISVSLGPSPPLFGYFSSSSDIASFHAMEKGVSVVFAAGNDGPYPSSVTNTAPWAISVAASTLDRTFPTPILLGNNVTFKGEGINSQGLNNTFLPLVDGAFVSRAGSCSLGSLIPRLVKGKVVLCFGTAGSDYSLVAAISVYQAGGVAVIFSEVPTRIIPTLWFIPVVYVDWEQGTAIRLYYTSSKSPVVKLSPGRSVVGETPAPAVAYFSSRGPNTLSADILKPDITAPGVNILAAWTPVVPPSPIFDKRVVNFNFLSGTSMSCPHVSGIVAILKSIHPKWSPAAIRSAIMTTAYSMDTSFDSITAGGSGKPANPFDFGAGHVDPVKAMNPGLVYDAGPKNYVLFLCRIGYNEQQIRTIVSSDLNITCPKNGPSASDLNYPSIAVANLKSVTTIKRTVTNVGPENCVYRAIVYCPPGVEVIIKPKILVFRPNIKTATFSVTLKALKRSEGVYNFGALVWSNGVHYVRSPIVVRVNNEGIDCEQKIHGFHCSNDAVPLQLN